jgi:DNA-binding beta-propeller fold protein YncE
VTRRDGAIRGRQKTRTLAARALAGLVLVAALLAGSGSTIQAASGASGVIASAPQACATVTVKVHAQHWVRVKLRHKVRGRRVPVIRHGKVVYIRVRVRYLKLERRLVCSAVAPAPMASGSLLGPSAPAPTEVLTPPPAGGPSMISHLEYVLQDGVTSVYDMDHEFKLLKTISLPQTTKSEVRGVSVAPSTHLMFVMFGGDGPANGSGNGSVLAYDLVSGKVLWEVKLSTGIDSGQVSPDAKKLYVPTGENTSTGIWNVLSTENGAVIGTIKGGSGAHNTVVSNDGGYVYLAGRTSSIFDVYETATGKVKEIGPMIGTVRPFTVNGSNTLSFTTATGFDGFQVSSVTTGKVLFSTSFGEVPKGFPFTAPSHGASLSPDEKEVSVIDAVHKEVQVWNVSKVKEGVAPTQIGVIPVAGLTGSESPCVYDCTRGGWLQRSVDGRFLLVGDSGEVIETATRKVLTTLSTLAQTKKSIEVDWQNGVPVATSGRTGVGGVG